MKYSNKYITFADTVRDSSGKTIPKETQLTSHDDWGTEQALDYIFELVPTKYGKEKTRKGTKLFFDPNSVEIEPFEMNNRPYRQLSDHYGVKFNISVKDVKRVKYSSLRLSKV